MSTIVITPSAYSSELHRELAYQSAVFTVLLVTTRPRGSRRGAPMLSADEVKQMELCMANGVAPAAFAAMLVKRDRDAARGAQ